VDELDNQRLGCLQFLHTLETRLVKNWSLSRNPKVKVRNEDTGEVVEEDNKNLKEFFKEPTIEFSDWVDAYKWSLYEKRFIKYRRDDEVFLCCPAGFQKEINTNSCREYFDHLENLNSSDFNTLMTKVHSVNYIQFNEINWKLSVCSCSLWQKNYICRHVIDAAVRKGLATYPTKVINVALERKRQLGRPKESTAALIRQPCEWYNTNANDYENESSSSSETDTISDNPPKRRKIDTNNGTQACTLETQPSTSGTQDKQYCNKCDAEMKKRRHYYCPNKCKQ
jgi:hypothetical protein